uniref:Transcription factor S-II n=1 Tax=Megaviridae environmental sample TaxID=1737588 RepID=A0A5J6VKJ1_9VIRU|nr:MAG: transcription factor S-II [Megaviridae environmental sample]
MIDKNLRDNTLKNLSKKFKPEIAIKIEESIYKFSSKYADDNNTPFLIEQIYQSKSDEIDSILVNKNLEYVTKSFKNKDIDPYDIAFMKLQDLDFEKFHKIKEKKDNIDKHKKPKGSSIYTCPKCKKKNSSISEQQTRSADEPTTIYVTCLECNHVRTL